MPPGIASNPDDAALSTRGKLDYNSTPRAANSEAEAVVRRVDRLAHTPAPYASASSPTNQRAVGTVQQHPSCSQREQDQSSMSLIGLLTNGLTHSSVSIPGPVFSATAEVGHAPSAAAAFGGIASPEGLENQLCGRRPVLAAAAMLSLRRATTPRRLHEDEAGRQRAVRRRVRLVLDEVLDELGESPIDSLT
jgi:hypothetical protein